MRKWGGPSRAPAATGLWERRIRLAQRLTRAGRAGFWQYYQQRHVPMKGRPTPWMAYATAYLHEALGSWRATGGRSGDWSDFFTEDALRALARSWGAPV